MFTQDIKGATTRATLLKSQAITSDTNGPAVDIRGYRGNVLLVFNIAAATAGSTPTMDVKIQSSADGSTSWADVSGQTLTQVTTTDSLQALSLDPDTCSAYIRAVFDIGGTSSPSFPCSAVLVGIPQRLS